MIMDLKKFIECTHDENALFVLKGYSLDAVGLIAPDLDAIFQNKIAWLFQLSQREQKIISFEEFVCLYDMILTQFSKIYIYENPLYKNFHPVEVILNDHITDVLIQYYDEDSDMPNHIDGLDEYTNIYSNFILTPYGIACCYNITENQLADVKIETHEMNVIGVPISEASGESSNYVGVNICNEVDYFGFIQQLFGTADNFHITWDSYTTGKKLIEDCLYKANAILPNRILKAHMVKSGVFDNTDIKKIMKSTWGYDEFRDIKVYDLDSLSVGTKETRTISQGEIIGNLVFQTEKCLRRENFRDIFVTAPTGAGKSLIFQLPAMYLAEKYNLVTLIISPLIGLMNDQVRSLEKAGYLYAKTINGDISPVIKQEILEDVKNSKCHILYLSPESLLARSDIEALIGIRRIGMIIIDEAHIVTTWGKQFRPDYWYLGDHVQKIFRAQRKKETDAHGFVIATFTATAIYEGSEDMYHETLNSLHMNDPITYLGYVRRENIKIEVSEVEKKNKAEYELNKFDELINIINASLMRNNKTLIYFPTVALITRFYDYCHIKKIGKYVGIYHGQLVPDEKDANFGDFHSGTRLIMLATKAFGMGIDIEDIAVVVHFAPTGNVCDYLQEIGRAARKKSIDGLAVYKHMSNDFKHINRMHGLSTIKKYQLIRVIEKILDLFNEDMKVKNRKQLKKRREMLIDTNNFSYIFETPNSQNDDSDLMSKVKTALLLIQKDYEGRLGYSPFYMRPIPMFKNGYFAISKIEQNQLNEIYPHSVISIYQPLNICEIDLHKIWQQLYKDKRDGISFPKFKYWLYSQNPKPDIVKQYDLKPALKVELGFIRAYEHNYELFFSISKIVLNENSRTGTYISLTDIATEISNELKINKFQAEGIVNVLIAAISIYQREFNSRVNSRMFRTREESNTGQVRYAFDSSIRDFFTWVNKGFKYVKDNVVEDKLYVVNTPAKNLSKEMGVILGILESARVLRFKSLGGSDSQIYLYVNTTKSLLDARNRPDLYRNRLLELIESRHEDSVKMLSFLFQNNFSSETIWEHIENYFLGIVPEELLANEKQ